VSKVKILTVVSIIRQREYIRPVCDANYERLAEGSIFVYFDYI